MCQPRDVELLKPTENCGKQENKRDEIKKYSERTSKKHKSRNCTDSGEEFDMFPVVVSVVAKISFSGILFICGTIMLINPGKVIKNVFATVPEEGEHEMLVNIVNSLAVLFLSCSFIIPSCMYSRTALVGVGCELILLFGGNFRYTYINCIFQRFSVVDMIVTPVTWLSIMTCGSGYLILLVTHEDKEADTFEVSQTMPVIGVLRAIAKWIWSLFFILLGFFATYYPCLLLSSCNCKAPQSKMLHVATEFVGIWCTIYGIFIATCKVHDFGYLGVSLPMLFVVACHSNFFLVNPFFPENILVNAFISIAALVLAERLFLSATSMQCMPNCSRKGSLYTSQSQSVLEHTQNSPKSGSCCCVKELDIIFDSITKTECRRL